MKSHSFITLAASFPLATLAQQCASGFHIIVARAALELPGKGSTGALADAIAARVPGSNSVGLGYPALPILYNESVALGDNSLHSDIERYVQKCADPKIVLLGYDQGAYVVGDVLGGAGQNAKGALEGKEAKAVKGVILLSDPTHVAGQPYDAGTATTNGLYPRSPASLTNLRKYSSIIKSYCDNGDTTCAGGKDSEANRQYLTKYQKAAADFIVSVYGH